MTNRQERRGRRARPLTSGAEGRPRNSGRRLLVLLAVAALVILSVASFQFTGASSVTPSASPSTSPSASAS
jgi:hypothetical protein